MKLQNTSTFKVGFNNNYKTKPYNVPLVIVVAVIVALYAPVLASVASFSAETSYVPEQKQIILEHDLKPIATFSDIESLNVITVK